MDDHLFFEQVPLGGNRNFGYIVGCNQEKLGALVDPAFIPEAMVQTAVEAGLKIVYVFNTHAHSDHTNGNATALALCPEAKLVGHPADIPDAAIACLGGETFDVGTIRIEAIHTPGHSPGSLCLMVAGRKLITGDELFVGKVGGTDFPRSDIHAQHHSLLEILLKLPDELEVFPGHDFGVSPSSTIGRERRENPFLQRPDFADFKWLKDNWAQYKKDHHIA